MLPDTSIQVYAGLRRELQQRKKRSNGIVHNVDRRRLPGRAGQGRSARKILENTAGMNGHVPVCHMDVAHLGGVDGRRCIISGDRQDQGQSCSSCSFPARTMAPSDQGRDVQVGWGRPRLTRAGTAPAKLRDANLAAMSFHHQVPGRVPGGPLPRLQVQLGRKLGCCSVVWEKQ